MRAALGVRTPSWCVLDSCSGQAGARHGCGQLRPPGQRPAGRPAHPGSTGVGPTMSSRYDSVVAAVRPAHQRQAPPVAGCLRGSAWNRCGGWPRRTPAKARRWRNRLGDIEIATALMVTGRGECGPHLRWPPSCPNPRRLTRQYHLPPPGGPLREWLSHCAVGY